MTGMDPAAAYSRASAQQRITALLDPGAQMEAPAGRVVIAQGTVAGTSVVAAASDPSSAHGAIGTGEAGALARLLEQARTARTPVVWLLDSAGANVEEGLAALGAFRRLFRAALSARLAQVPMFAVLGRSCFGGASMLACVCDARSYLPQTRLATSGPAVIEGAGGKGELDASDQHAITDLMGSGSRVVLHAQDSVREDTLHAGRAALVDWLKHRQAPPGVDQAHAGLAARLTGAGFAPVASDSGADTPRRAAAAMLPPGYDPVVHDNLFCALPAQGSQRAVFLGALGGSALGAQECWTLAGWLLRVRAVHPGSPVVLVLDAQGHAARARDERVLLSDYLVHLALVIAQLAHDGHRTVLWIPGAASGASYVAFAAPVERVSALPSARIAVLPAAAVRQILGARAPARSEDWLATGVADGLLDARLEAYGEHAGGAL